MPRGKKTCPKCGAEVGPRLKVCACGHEFVFKNTTMRTAKNNVDTPTPHVPPRVPPRVPPKPKPKPKVDSAEGADKNCQIILIKATDREAVGKFIADLKLCSVQSRRQGGAYSAFLRLPGKQKLQIEVWYPLEAE